MKYQGGNIFTLGTVRIFAVLGYDQTIIYSLIAQIYYTRTVTVGNSK